MMNIQLMSDVHGRWNQVKLHPEAQLVLALGDMAEGVEGVEWLSRLGKPVIYVPGNHEYYGTDIGTRLGELREAAVDTQVIIADKQTITVGNVRFLCATLWSDHNSLNLELMAHSLKSLNDYRRIDTTQWASHYENKACYESLRDNYEHKNPSHIGLFPAIPDKMNPLVSLVLHQQALNYLTLELEKPWSGQTIVLTHHAPTLNSLLFAGYFSTMDVGLFPSVLKHTLKPHKIGAYASALDYLFSNHRIDMWMHGHLHEGLRFSLHGCDVITNPTGYNNMQNSRYNPSFLIKSDDASRHLKILCLTIYQSLQMQSEMGILVKKCLMQDETGSKTLFGTQPHIISFVRIYNSMISALLNQKPRDQRRPDFYLEPLTVNLFTSHPHSINHLLDTTQRIRFLHDILNRIQDNENRSREWLQFLNATPELATWTVESDI